MVSWNPQVLKLLQGGQLWYTMLFFVLKLNPKYNNIFWSRNQSQFQARPFAIYRLPPEPGIHFLFHNNKCRLRSTFCRLFLKRSNVIAGSDNVLSPQKWRRWSPSQPHWNRRHFLWGHFKGGRKIAMPWYAIQVSTWYRKWIWFMSEEMNTDWSKWKKLSHIVELETGFFFRQQQEWSLFSSIYGIV